MACSAIVHGLESKEDRLLDFLIEEEHPDNDKELFDESTTGLSAVRSEDPLVTARKSGDRDW